MADSYQQSLSKEQRAFNKWDREHPVQAFKTAAGESVKTRSGSAYGMEHTPLYGDETVSADDVFNEGKEISAPRDILDKPEIYGGADKEGAREAAAVLRRVQGKPDAKITIYRSSPSDEINAGDWVSLSKHYAERHAASHGDGTWKVSSKKVKASDVYWAGDDLNEWGYAPKDSKGVIQYSLAAPFEKAADWAQKAKAQGAAKTAKEAWDYTKAYADRVIDGKAAKERTAATYDELKEQIENPDARYEQTKRGRSWASRAKEMVHDAMQPVWDAFGGAAKEMEGKWDVGENKSNGALNKLSERLQKHIDALEAIGKKYGQTSKSLFHFLDNVERVIYVPAMNKALRRRKGELLARTEANLEKLNRQDLGAKSQKAYDDLRKEQPGTPEYAKASRRVNELQTLISERDEMARTAAELRLQLENFDKYDGAIQKKQVGFNDDGEPVDSDGNVIPQDRQTLFAGGLSSAEAEALLAAAKQKPYFDEVRAIGKAMEADRFETIKRLRDAKVIGDDVAQNWLNNKEYMPTFGYATDNPYEQSGTQFIGDNLRMKMRTGRDELSASPIQNMFRQQQAWERQIALKDFNDGLIKNGDSHGFKVEPTDERTAPPGSMLIMDTADGNTTRYWKVSAPDNPELIARIRGLDRKPLTNPLARFLSKYIGFFSYGVTRAVPFFGLTNAVRDIPERITNIIAQSMDGGKLGIADGYKMTAAAFADLPRQVALMAKFQRLEFQGKEASGQEFAEFNEFRKNGGLLTRNMAQMRELSQFSKFAEGSDKTGWQAQARNWGRFTAKLVNHYNEGWEDAAAFTVYRQLIKHGIEPKEAARITLQSMNLNKRGTASAALGVFYPFNATRMAGAANVLRNLSTKRGLATSLAMLGAMTATYEMTKALFGGEPDAAGNDAIDRISGTRLARGLYIPLGDGKFISVPTPFGTPNLMWNAAVGIARYAHGQFTWGDAVSQAAEAALDELSPAGTPSAVGLNQNPAQAIVRVMMPEFLHHAVNIGFNRNDFGTDLIGEYIDPNLPINIQGKRSTEQIYKWAAAHLPNGIAPEYVKEMAQAIPFGKQFADVAEALRADNVGAAAGAALGASRLLKQNVSGSHVFYDARDRVQSKFQKLQARYGEVPKAADSGVKDYTARLDTWLNSIPGSALSDKQRKAVRAYGILIHEQNQHGKTDEQRKAMQDKFLSIVGNAT